MTSNDQNHRWHLSKSVPISLMLTIGVQTIALIIWAARLDARVAALETTQLALFQRVGRIEDITAQVAIIAERQRVGYQLLEENTRKMDRLSEAVGQLTRQK